ncbi:hypothetical protein C7H79_16350 [Nitrosomonas supralitoralis]|uniref:Uncharacterized protein n=1 Tax=Nitrosomonas supralitoralis TaxID=2116706 RepID=A0A2P7NR68_9PROT|nr:hypothetical protein C7H79_16350 [Nitrosomonas supralitoralis]
MNDRINNPKATESAIAKNKQILSELTARVNGMRRQIDASGKIYQGHRSQNQNGQKDAVSIDDFFQSARRVSRLNDEKMEEMLKSQIYPSFYVESIDGSEIANEWQMEVDMAQSMIEESVANFSRQAGERGSYPAEIAKVTAESNAFVVDGKPIVTGTISRQDDGSLAIFSVSKRSAFRGTKGDNGIRQIPLVQFVKGGQIFYPGSAEYDTLLNEAASIEDEINDKGFLDNGFSDIVPEIAQRRKVEMMASYSTHGYALPQPYFPFVITKDNTAVRRSIKESQKSIVKSIQYGSFVAPASLAVVKIDLDSSIMLSAMREYAIANNLTLTLDDFEGSPYNLTKTIGALISEDEFGEALTGRTQQEIEDQVRAFMREKLFWFDYGDKDPLVDYFPYNLNVLKQAAIKRLMDAIASAPQQTDNETAATQEDTSTRIIGIRIDTTSWPVIMEWKEYIKEAADDVGGGRYKWDKLNKAWNVYQPVWDKLMTDRPNTAPDILVLVDGTLSKI